MLEVRVLLSRLLKLLERTLVKSAYQLIRTLLVNEFKLWNLKAGNCGTS